MEDAEARVNYLCRVAEIKNVVSTELDNLAREFSRRYSEKIKSESYLHTDRGCYWNIVLRAPFKPAARTDYIKAKYSAVTLVNVAFKAYDAENPNYVKYTGMFMINGIYPPLEDHQVNDRISYVNVPHAGTGLAVAELLNAVSALAEAGMESRKNNE